MLADMGADGDENGVEPSRRFLREYVFNLPLEDNLDAHGLDPSDLLQQLLSRKPKGRNAKLHHAPGQRPGFVDHDGVTQPSEVISRGKPARSGADDEDAFAAGRRFDFEGPIFRCGQITEKALDRVNADRRVEVFAVAGAFARVVADAAVHGRHGIVANQRLPGVAILPGLRQGEPGLDVLAGRTRVIAGRLQVDVNRASGATGACPLLSGQIHDRRHVVWFGPHVPWLRQHHCNARDAMPSLSRKI
jgi:hypothetical protein